MYEPVKTLWVGMVTNEDEVLGCKCTVTRSESNFLHRANGYHHGLKWRMLAGGTELFWWEPPTQLQIELVTAWLNRRGEYPVTNSWTRWEEGITPSILAKQDKSPTKFKPWATTVDEHH